MCFWVWKYKVCVQKVHSIESILNMKFFLDWLACKIASCLVHMKDNKRDKICNFHDCENNLPLFFFCTIRDTMENPCYSRKSRKMAQETFKKFPAYQIYLKNRLVSTAILNLINFSQWFVGLLRYKNQHEWKCQINLQSLIMFI